MRNEKIPPIIQIGDVLLSSDILTEEFCCDLSVCRGACCVEGDAGAPVTLDEVAALEDSLDTVWPDLSAQAQAVIDRQGVAYTDRDGDLVTSIVGGKDCVFTCAKPISCALYPIREKTFSDGTVGLNYHQWQICQCGRDLGRRLHLPLYQFLKGPLIRRFGREWYDELCQAARMVAQN